MLVVAHGFGRPAQPPWLRVAAVSAVLLGTLVGTQWVVLGLAVPESRAWAWSTALSCQWARVLHVDLQPNVGLAWYLFAEVLPRYLRYFSLVFAVQPGLYLVPLLIRFGNQPLLCFSITFSIVSMLSLYPTIGDAPLALVLLYPHPGPVGEMGRGWALAGVVAVAVTLLMPAMSALWLLPGAGNANYYFNMCLVYNLCLGSVVSAFMAGSLKHLRNLRWQAKQCQQ